MTKVQEIDRSIVAVFDIEGFSKEDPETQARLVISFIEYLSKSLSDLKDIEPDAFSTGDGAIVSIGRRCEINRHNTKLFLDFVINFTKSMLKNGLIVKTVVNYSEKDRVLVIEGSESIQGKYIQIGDTINIASRLMSFCEPREIMISESAHKLLRKVGLHEAYPFFKNEAFTAKHNEKLETFTYDPPKDEQAVFYSPRSPLHYYKKYKYFPPIKGSLVEYFVEHSLDFELKKVISNSFDSMRELNNTMSFISWHTVLEVLMQLPYDPSDTVYVLSRNDRASGFWTQPRKNKYITHLKGYASKYGGYINQTRVIVYDDSEPERLMPENDIFFDLEKLHNTNTFFSFPSSCLLRYEKLNDLIFGFTLSTKHKYAVVPIPAPEALGTHTPKLENIGETLKFYYGYDVSYGPMRAIITADNRFVKELIEEVGDLLKDPRIHKLK